MDISERTQSVEEICDNVAVAVNLPDAQRTELDRRLENYRRNPNAGDPWEIVKKRIVNDRQTD